ncbi:Hypothetical predicted protein [Pelobates cultripes]|uniref:Uncharacterized protein n=1 Tax=Pelobates cultripes TaxID=61616 RepID=A0AAD1WZE3_PELCU|nr:Hypothetical predicted protein [Pelobates cultripes]
MVQSEVQAITTRVQTTETDITDLQRNIAVVGDSVRQLQAHQSTLTLSGRPRLENQSEKSEDNGVSDTVVEDLPRFIKRLVNTLLQAKQAKQFTIESPLDFESRTISIFQDLHRSTLLWRKTMNPSHNDFKKPEYHINGLLLEPFWSPKTENKSRPPPS